MKMPAGGPKTSDGQAFLPRKAREARGGSCKAPRAKWGGAGGNEIPRAKLVSGGELVHRIVFARRLQRRFAGEIFLVIVADVAAAHTLVLHACDPLTDLGALGIGRAHV